jgi:type IV pilus assembly protein PilA
MLIGGRVLIEVIVVLVILAILAAIAIPALTGYIDKANDKAIISQTRTAVVAAQAIVSDAYGTGTTKSDELAAKITTAEIQKLSGDTSIASVGAITLSGAAIEKMTVVANNGKRGTFDSTRTTQYEVG